VAQAAQGRRPASQVLPLRARAAVVVAASVRVDQAEPEVVEAAAVVLRPDLTEPLTQAAAVEEQEATLE